MHDLTFHAQTEDETVEFGAKLAAMLTPGTTVGLCGTLGAGKTRLVQAVAEALGASPGTVVSPTFVLIQEYGDATPPVYHVDTYRLADEDEFFELGLDEYFEGDGITFVEWADRFSEHLPKNRLDITIDVTGKTSRRFTLEEKGTFRLPRKTF
ncbi:MAG: tRNA (adenosine(37)-N6)-threonylcarbamoyltransferase complex ATPase subunit type 1 TsaE [Planctomycetia bacterium]|jgi:tRNA threonylcarbamoyladenosine biosynthesis protein TsaE